MSRTTSPSSDPPPGGAGLPGGPGAPQIEVRHETRDVSPMALLALGVGFLFSAVIIYLLVFEIFRDFRALRPESAAPPAAAVSIRDQLPPEPRLQEAPGHEIRRTEELRLLRQAEDRVLHSYGWVDRRAGVVRIPIEEAMRLLLVHGLPARPASAAGPPPAPALQGAPWPDVGEGVPLYSSSGRMMERSAP